MNTLDPGQMFILGLLVGSVATGIGIAIGHLINKWTLP